MSAAVPSWAAGTWPLCGAGWWLTSAAGCRAASSATCSRLTCSCAPQQATASEHSPCVTTWKVIQVARPCTAKQQPLMRIKAQFCLLAQLTRSAASSMSCSSTRCCSTTAALAAWSDWCDLLVRLPPSCRPQSHLSSRPITLGQGKWPCRLQHLCDDNSHRKRPSYHLICQAE